MDARSSIRRPAISAIAVAALAIACYLPSFAGVFLLDDRANVVDNPWLRNIWPPGPGWWAIPGRGLDGRPVVGFSFALQNAVLGLDAWSCHAVNLAIHVANALLVLAIARRALRALGAGDDFAAIALAALWTVHPLATEAVTYVVQRYESLASLFMLVAFLAAQRALESPRDRAWAILAGLASWLAIGSKEIAAVLPLLVIAYAVAVRGEAVGAALRNRTRLWIALFSSWLGLLLLFRSRGAHANVIGTGLGIGPLEYAETQAVAIARYLRLVFVPHPLVFDYGWPRPESAAQWIACGALVVALLAASAWAVARRKPAGFLGAWFFLILAPTSSFVPIATQYWAEHRMYLPLAAALAPVAVLLARLPRAAGGAFLFVAVVALGFTTAARNREYASAETIWRGALAARPDNARAHGELATLLRARGDLLGTREHFAATVRLQPDDPTWRNNYGAILWELRALPEAEEQFRATVRLEPNAAMPHASLGRLLVAQGRLDEAEVEMREAARLRPDWPTPRRELAFLLVDRGRFAEAEPMLAALHDLAPDDAAIALKLAACRARKTR